MTFRSLIETLYECYSIQRQQACFGHDHGVASLAEDATAISGLVSGIALHVEAREW